MATEPPEGFRSRSLVLHDEPAGAKWLRLYRRTFPDPLGFGGSAKSRFSPPPEAAERYGIVYLGSSVNVTVAETLVRDRGDGRLGDLPIELAEFEAWACAEIEVVTPLRLADLRGDGPLRMGIPSDVAHAADWRLGQLWSAALHAHDLQPDGLIYLSRFTGEPNLAVFERALPKLAATRIGALLDRRAQTVVRITAPGGGVIRTLSVRNGMTVSQGQTLAEISGLGSVWLNVSVPEATAGQVRPGQAVTVTLTAFPGEQFVGRVSAILPEAAAESRTLTARVELPNRGGRLRPGMYGQAQFAGAASPALLVPSEAVIRTGRRALVMLAQPGGRFRPAEVQVGREAGDRTEILAGLQAGEQVVASGQFLLDSEASLAGVQARPIQPRPPAAAPPTAYETTGRLERLHGRSITLSHQPVPALQWPAMTMSFTLADPKLAEGLKTGDQVRFAFDQAGGVPTVRRIAKLDAAR